jgi:hypothetical protein
MPRWLCRANRGRALVIAAALFVSYAYFYQGEGFNQNSRFDLVRAIVEKHTLRIDAYHENTRDKALMDGHFYSEKAPGLAFTAVPVWQASNIALRAARKDTSSARGKTIVAERYLATIVTVALPAAAAAACLFLLALKLGASVEGAGFAALALGLATPFWCYSTLFWGHAPAAACLLFAFAAAMELRQTGSASRDVWLGACVGLAAGWATVTEFPSAPPAAILALLALAYAWPGGGRRLVRVATGIAAGALPCVLVLMIHNAIAFGSPFRIGYVYNVMAPSTLTVEQRRGLMGVTYPKAYVLREILVGQYRGLLLLAPVIAAAPFGLWLLGKRAEARKGALAAAVIALYYVLFNASYIIWDGGWTYGPRFLSPALPLLCLPLALVWTRSALPLRSLLAVLALFGAFLSLVAVSTFAMPPDYVKSPVRQLLWPAFSTGHLSPLPGTWNLGMLAGLPGLTSLIPLFLLWGAASVAWVWLGRLSHASEPSTEVSRVLNPKS